MAEHRFRSTNMFTGMLKFDFSWIIFILLDQSDDSVSKTQTPVLKRRRKASGKALGVIFLEQSEISVPLDTNPPLVSIFVAVSSVADGRNLIIMHAEIVVIVLEICLIHEVVGLDVVVAVCEQLVTVMMDGA